jgi:hypothetical protein
VDADDEGHVWMCCNTQERAVDADDVGLIETRWWDDLAAMYIY